MAQAVCIHAYTWLLKKGMVSLIYVFIQIKSPILELLFYFCRKRLCYSANVDKFCCSLYTTEPIAWEETHNVFFVRTEEWVLIRIKELCETAFAISSHHHSHGDLISSSPCHSPRHLLSHDRFTLCSPRTHPTGRSSPMSHVMHMFVLLNSLYWLPVAQHTRPKHFCCCGQRSSSGSSLTQPNFFFPFVFIYFLKFFFIFY